MIFFRIQPLATCIDRTGGVARYSDVVYGQHLVSKVSKNFASGVGATLAPTPPATPPPTTATAEQQAASRNTKELIFSLPPPPAVEPQAHPFVLPEVTALRTNTAVPQDQVDTVLKALIEFVQAGTKIIQALTPPGTPSAFAPAQGLTAVAPHS